MKRYQSAAKKATSEYHKGILLAILFLYTQRGKRRKEKGTRKTSVPIAFSASQFFDSGF
jgi:hypothetical protein